MLDYAPLNYHPDDHVRAGGCLDRSCRLLGSYELDCYHRLGLWFERHVERGGWITSELKEALMDLAAGANPRGTGFDDGVNRLTDDSVPTVTMRKRESGENPKKSIAPSAGTSLPRKLQTPGGARQKGGSNIWKLACETPMRCARPRPVSMHLVLLTMVFWR